MMSTGNTSYRCNSRILRAIEQAWRIYGLLDPLLDCLAQAWLYSRSDLRRDMLTRFESKNEYCKGERLDCESRYGNDCIVGV